jgi:GntR family transcriptional repressor for pyruvate dehydrogenase complex
LAALSALVAEIPGVASDRDGWLKNDMAFHAMLAQATKNELFSLLLDSLADVLTGVRRMGFSVPNAAARTMKYHGAILEEVRRRDPDGARQAMRDHLDEAEATMRQALETQAAHSAR